MSTYSLKTLLMIISKATFRFEHGGTEIQSFLFRRGLREVKKKLVGVVFLYNLAYLCAMSVIITYKNFKKKTQKTPGSEINKAINFHLWKR